MKMDSPMAMPAGEWQRRQKSPFVPCVCRPTKPAMAWKIGLTMV